MNLAGTGKARMPGPGLSDVGGMTDLADGNRRAVHGNAGRMPPTAASSSISLNLRGALNHEALLDALQETAQRYPTLRDSGWFPAAEDGTAWARLAELAPGVHRLTLFAQGGAGEAEILPLLAREVGHVYTCRLLGLDPNPASPVPPAARGRPPAARRRADRLPLEDDRCAGRLPADGDQCAGRLPADRVRSAHRPQVTASASLPIGDQLAAAAKAFAAANGAGQFSVYLTAFAVLLARFGGTPRLQIGLAPVEVLAATRNQLSGSPAEWMALSLPVDSRRTGQQVLESVGDLIEAALEGSTVWWGDPLAGRPAGDRLTAGFSCPQSLPTDCIEYLGLAVEAGGIEPGTIGSGTWSCDSVLSVATGERGLEATWQYDGSLFDAATIRAWLECYRTLLQCLVDEGASPVALMELVSDTQLRQLASWNDTRTVPPVPPVPPVPGLVHEWVREASRRAAARTALVIDGTSLRHLDLQRRAARLARELRRLGSVRGARVGLLLEPGFEMVVAQLAILGSGAACVPLDADLPPDDRDRLVAYAELDLLVSHSDSWRLPAAPEAPLLLLDRIAPQVARQSDEPLPEDELAARPEDPAFVMFAAASAAGPAPQPMGTILSHRAMLSCLQAMTLRPGIGPKDRVVVFPDTVGRSFSLELFAALGAGAEVVVAGPEDRADARLLNALLTSTRATAMQAGADTWRRLLDAPGKRKSGFKALVASAGLDLRLAGELLSRNVELWCFYGVVEATGWSTSARIESHLLPGNDLDADRRLIGKPNAGCQAWILDEHGQVCPIGVPGDLFLGGEGLATGYLKKLPLTARAFVPDRVGAHPGRKLFRTRDRGRWRHDGLLEILSTPESRLGSVDDDRHAPVNKTKRGADKHGAPVGNLGDKPARAVENPQERVDKPVEKFGNPVDKAGEKSSKSVDSAGEKSGKSVDKPVERLGNPVDKRPAAVDKKTGFLENPVEKVVEKSARPVENRVDRPVDRPVNKPVEAAAHDLVDKPVTKRDDRPAKWLDTLVSGLPFLAGPWTAAPDRQPSKAPGRGSPVLALSPQASRSKTLLSQAPLSRSPLSQAPLSLLQQEAWRREVSSNVGQAICSVHRFAGGLDEQAFESAFNHVVRRQTAFRTVVKERDGVQIQKVLAPTTLHLFPAEDLSTLAREKREDFIRFRSDALGLPRFDLGQGPLLRPCLIRFSEREHVLILLVHPIVADERSVELFFDDMSSLYREFAEGDPAVLQPLPRSYCDFAVAQGEGASDGPAKPPSLARRHPAPSPEEGGEPHLDPALTQVESGRSHMASVVLPHDLGQDVRGLAADQFVSPADVYLAVWYVLAQSVCKRDGASVVWPKDGRLGPQLDRLAGPFTTLIPLLPADRPDWSFVNLLRSVAASRTASGTAAPERDAGPTNRAALAASAGAAGAAGVAGAETARAWETMLRYHDAVAGATSWGGLGCELRAFSRTDGTEDIAATLIDGSAGVRVSLLFASGSASFETMARVADQYRRLLVTVVRDPRQRLQVLAAGVPEHVLGSPPSRLAPASPLSGIPGAPGGAASGRKEGHGQSGSGRPQAIVFAALLVVAALWAFAEGYFSGVGL